MSKCDLRIEFDRVDRTYEGGDKIHGTLFVHVNADTQCNGLILEHCWQTHGRGNTDRGDVQTTVLTQGQWSAGEEFEFTFSFVAPQGPPTYRGHYLNIDHYIKARVDIPWAFDPQIEEEYVLLPGSGSYGNAPSVESEKGGVAGFFASAGIPVGVVLLLVSVFFFPIGIVALPIAIIVLFFSMRNMIAEKRIGSVRLSTGSISIPPGSAIPFKLDFVPRKSCSLNKVTAKLLARESSTSGSGTRRSTHTHILHERTFELVGHRELVAGEPIRLEYNIPIPDIGAYSFEANENRLHWELESRIDIPLWPDWLDKRGVLVRAGDVAEPIDATIVEPPVIAEIRSSDTGVGVPLAAPAQVEDKTVSLPPAESPPATGDHERTNLSVDAAETTEEHDPLEDRLLNSEPVKAPSSIAATTSPSDSSSSPIPPEPLPAQPLMLVKLLGELAEADPFGDEHENLIRRHEHETFPCSIVINRIDRTFGIVEDEQYRGGRTIIGELAGVDAPVAVQIGKNRNAQIQELKKGDVLELKCLVSKWDALYKRTNMLAV